VCNGSGIIAAIPGPAGREPTEQSNRSARASAPNAACERQPYALNERKTPARRKRNLIEAGALTAIPAVLMYPVLVLFATHLSVHAVLFASIFLVVCAAAEASGLIAATRVLTGDFDAFEAGGIACLVIGVVTLGFVAWALATGYRP
jgi:hypothetical protein